MILGVTLARYWEETHSSLLAIVVSHHKQTNKQAPIIIACYLGTTYYYPISEFGCHSGFCNSICARRAGQAALMAERLLEVAVHKAVELICRLP